MTRSGAQLARLEGQAQQQRAAAETGSGWACPWNGGPPGLPEDVRAAWEWAASMHSRTRAQVWPVPPTGAALVFEQEAAKADPARLAWLVMARLARVEA